MDPDSVVPQWDARGALTMKRCSGKVKEPGKPPLLKPRLTVMRDAYQMVALRCTNRAEPCQGL